MNSTGLTWKLWLFPLLGYLSVTLFEFKALALSPLLLGGLQVQDVPPATTRPPADVGEWRDQSRPGYRAQPTASSVAFYRYIMDKAGRGEEINTIETLLIRSAIANRTWPEAPEITFRHQALQQWILQQPENGRLFTDPDGWLRGRLSDAAFEQLVEAGFTDQDTPHTQSSERFRVFWTGLTPEQREALPVGDWMRRYYVRLGFDMRSDEQRRRDIEFEKKQEALREAGIKHQADTERQIKEAAEADERQRQKWFNDNWAEEDRRIAREQAERDLIWGEFVAFFMKLSPEDRARTLQEMTVEQREELDRRLPPEVAGAEPAPPALIGSDTAVVQVRLPVGHHAKPPETDLSAAGTSGAAVVAEAAKTEADRIAAMHSFRVVTPSIWEGASDQRGFHVKRQSAVGGAIHQMCPYQATVYAEAGGKTNPSFAPKTNEEIRAKLDSEAVEHRKWGREPEIRPFAIGPFNGFLLETRPRFKRGGWSDSGYRDSGTDAYGQGWVTLNGRTFEVFYKVGSTGCWDNSQRPFQESQTQAAVREAQAILAGLRLVAEPSVTQVPYTGPKLDGSDLPAVRLEPAELPRLNPGETVIVRATVENLSADDRPLRFEWTGEHEGDGSEVLIRATQPGTYSLAVSVEGAQYALGSASLNYEVSALQVRAERLTPYATGPVPAGVKIPLRVSLTEEGRPATGDYIYRWQPDPEVQFEIQDVPNETVTASFPEPGRYLVWVQVLRRQGDVLSTVIQSEQLEIVVDTQPTRPQDPSLESGAMTHSDKSKTETYSWKLVKVIDFENQAGWTMPESENWQFKTQYARGDFTATVFNKADDSFKYGARVIWSSPPLVMKPGQKIELTANLAETENTHHSNSSGAQASADFAPPDRGWGTRGDFKFLSADGEEGVNINGAHRATASDTFSAVAPVGKEGDQLALRLGLYMGSIMGTSYVYELVPGEMLDITGVWQHGTVGETWTFTPNSDGTYTAVEKGFGNGRGSATVSGNKIHIDYQTPEGVSGEYDIVVDADGQTGRGTWTSDLPDSGYNTFTKKTPIATSTPSQPTATADSNAFTIRVGEHRLKQGETAAIAVEVLNSGEVSNLNVLLEFDSNVVQVQAKPTIGQVAGQRLFEANYNEPGSIRLGFAGSAGITQDGTLAMVPLVATGTPGSRTPIKVQVTQANRADGQRMEPQVIPGSIAIVAVDAKPPTIQPPTTQPPTTLPPITPPASSLTTKDALKALRMSVKLLPEDLGLDVDENGQVTSNDARIILKQVTKRE